MLAATTVAVMGALSLGVVQSQAAFEPIDLNPKLESGEYTQKVDNFVVILDASSTMSQEGKFAMAQEVARRLNQTIPDIPLEAAIRTLGENRTNETRLVYGHTRYRQGALESAIVGVRGFGATPLGKAIEAAIEDLRGVPGDTAVIILSDGRATDRTAITAAETMKEIFGPRVCIYAVLFGDDPVGRSTMEQIAKVGDCGYFVSADEIYTPQGMATFAENAFLEKAPEPPAVAARLDSDGDGVFDDLDQCPDTPGGVKVDEQGCPLDSDGDGVADYIDECPDTPTGATVNHVGCWAFEGIILFGFDKSEIRPEAEPLLKEVVSVLKRNPAMKLGIDGHTCNIGSAAYNQKLSENRANAVVNYLVSHGIPSYRLTSEGYGFKQPAASNETEEGRAKNRRVELSLR
jgi:OOP family OmpA-OmpF porin